MAWVASDQVVNVGLQLEVPISSPGLRGNEPGYEAGANMPLPGVPNSMYSGSLLLGYPLALMSICIPTFVISDVDLGIIMLCYLSLVITYRTLFCSMVGRQVPSYQSWRSVCG